jgi:beta-lactamase superfamily II metal-dependent hydrolase
MRNVSALLLAESGYAPLNPPELIAFLHPQLALLSVVPADKTGLPSPETLDALQGYNLLRTDQNGWIELTTDGKEMWVEVEKKVIKVLPGRPRCVGTCCIHLGSRSE